jgi:AraC family transcriptional regulator
MLDVDKISADAGTARANIERQRIISRPYFTLRHTFTKSCEFEPHSHSACTVTAILSGKMSARIGEQSFELAPGDVLLTDVGQNHSAEVFDVEFLSVRVSPVLINELVNELGLIRTSAEVLFRSSLIRDDAISALVRSIINELAIEEIGQSEMLEALVRQIVIHLLRNHLTVRKAEQIEMSRAGPVDRRLRRAIEFMHDNFGSEIALEEIAAAAYLSEYHFARLFKQISGVTPHVYLANLRIDRARKLLTESSLPISQIASQVGYQSQSHFTKMFKSVTGVTPRVYREASR